MSTKNLDLLDLVVKTATCSECGQTGCKRHSIRQTTQRDLGGVTVCIRRSVHYCHECRKFFKHKEGALRRGVYTAAVHDKALALLRKGVSLERVAKKMKNEHQRHVPPTTLHEWKVEDMEHQHAQTKKAIESAGGSKDVPQHDAALTTV